MDCFAKKEHGECIAIDTGTHKNRCPGNENCKFKRSCQEKRASDDAVLVRIASLPVGVQSHIAEKYYGGKMQWAQTDGL